MYSALAITAFLGLLNLLSQRAYAHSWNEQLSLIGPNGSFVSNGYPRGYVARQDPAFNGNSMMWMIPGAQAQRIHINDQDLLCHTNQRNTSQSQGYPRLAVSPGSSIAMKYLENGHVTSPQNQPGKQQKGGTVFVFGTTQPKPDETLAGVLQWNSDGSGGDKRGKLLQAQNFDDDRCYQMNMASKIAQDRMAKFPNPKPGQPGTTNELWCESNVMVPNDAPVGKPYTLYWVWQWPTMPGTSGYQDGKDEYYTTCNDVDVQAQAPETGFFANILQQQDPQEKPVDDFKSRTALQPTPWPKGVLQAKDAPSTPSSAPEPAPAASVSQPSAAAPAPAATAAPAAAQPAPGAISMIGNQAVAGAPQQAPATSPTPPTASTMPSTPATGAMPSGSSMVVPMALNLYTATSSSAPAPPATTPSVAGLVSATPSPAAPTTAAASPSAAAGSGSGMQVLTVPAGSPIFMFNSAGQVVTLAKRAASTSTSAVTSATRSAQEGNIRIAPRHRVAHAHHAGVGHGRWTGR